MSGVLFSELGERAFAEACGQVEAVLETLREVLAAKHGGVDVGVVRQALLEEAAALAVEHETEEHFVEAARELFRAELEEQQAADDAVDEVERS